MIESGLVYIHYVPEPTAFAGCGALVEGPFIVTCRHVWDQAIAAQGNSGTVHIRFPPPRGEGNAEFRAAKPVDDCNGLGNPPDLVILATDDVPSGSASLVLARAKSPQHGPGYVLAGLRRNGPDTPVRDVTIPGSIGARIDGSGLRQFTGAEGKGYFTDLGSSGSPLLIESTDELAGVISLSETGLIPGAAPIREAFAVPSVTIHRHISDHIGREWARENGIPEGKVPQILKMIGAADVSIAEIRTRLRYYYEDRQVAAASAKTNLGTDIELAIEKSRRLSAAFQPVGAMAVLDSIIAEETATRRQRLVPLLEEKAQQQGLVCNYEGAKKTLRELLAIDADQTWRWIDLGDIFVTTGALDDAIAAFRQALAAAERIIKTNPSNTGWQRNLSVSHDRIGDVQTAQGDFWAALKSFQASLAIAERLAEADPTNAGWQRDLSVSYDRIGDVQAALGERPAALKSFQASLAIADGLAETDPANAGWQHDLSVSYDRIGDVQAALGDLPAALKSFQASLAIAERFAEADPANAGWQRDVSVSLNKSGDIQAALGDLPAALKSFEASLAIAHRLAKADPANAGWQRDVALSFGGVAMVETKQGLTPQALAGFRRGRDIIAELMQKSPNDATLPKDLAWFDRQIAALEKP